MSDCLVYWKLYDPESNNWLDNRWSSNSRILYNNVHAGDSLWAVSTGQFKKPTEWHLLERLVVKRKRITRSDNYFGYEIIGDPKRNQRFQIEGQQDLTKLLHQLEFLSGKRIQVRGKAIAERLQTPRPLTDADSRILGTYSQTIRKADSQEDEADLEEKKIRNRKIPQTEKEQLIKARRGQGVFRKRVEQLENSCRMTGIKDIQLLVASHIKPWKDSNDEEKLDGNNGLLLSPHVDKLFDAGWISFSDSGKVLCRDKNVTQTMKVWGLRPNVRVGSFNRKQQFYLKFHRAKWLFGSNNK